LEKGFTATSVDEICEAASVTKGSFFHYFESKEGLAIVALQHFSNCQMERFEAGPYNAVPDPLDRLYGFLDFMITGVKNPEAPRSCLMGNLTQELSQTHSEIRSVCADNFSWHNRKLQNLIDDAVRAHPPKSEVGAESLAKYFYSVIQGSLIFVKAWQDTELMAANIEHFKRYLQTLFPEKMTAQ